MTVSPIGVPQKPYQGAVFSLPNLKRFGQIGTAVRLSIDWKNTYGAGDNLPALAIIASFLTGSNANIPQTFVPVSVYINNLGSNVPIYIYFPDSQYEIVCPANSEGWFQVTTNSALAWIFGLNFQTAFPVSSTIIFTDIVVPNYVNNAVPQAVSNWLASLNIGAGGGANVATITPTIAGSGYANGGLSITGGGGSGATAQGTLDQWGRFVSVMVTDGGNDDYTGSPVITPTASNTVAAFNGSTTYTNGELFLLNGTIWTWDDPQGVEIILSSIPYTSYPGNAYPLPAGTQALIGSNVVVATQSIPAQSFWPSLSRVLGPTTPTNNSGGWVNSGIASPASAQFSSTLTTPTAPSSIQASGFNAPALGDQPFARAVAITGTGVLIDNVFKSPFGSGFIYLTEADWIVALGSAALTAAVELIASDGTLAFGQVDLISAAANSQPGLQMKLRGNIRLDATKQWQIKCAAFTGTGTLTVNFMHTFTYSQF